MYKALEKCVFKHVFNHFGVTITPFQSGFIKGDCTVHQLNDFHNFIFHDTDQGKAVRAVFCDVTKASERVWRADLIRKLRSVSIADKLHD